MQEEYEHEREKSENKRKEEDQIRREQEEKERKELEENYQRKLKDMTKKYEEEARKQAEEFNEFRQKYTKDFAALVDKHMEEMKEMKQRHERQMQETRREREERVRVFRGDLASKPVGRRFKSPTNQSSWTGSWRGASSPSEYCRGALEQGTEPQNLLGACFTVQPPHSGISPPVACALERSLDRRNSLNPPSAPGGVKDLRPDLRRSNSLSSSLTSMRLARSTRHNPPPVCSPV
ncbi:hypothetical protein L3Q82_007005 [Scortum barcoo]|uniref:Uncharacterized protein n=1 Tax=Scortum barcoo TaxID=214431 RepID=A0ACB8WWJ7_9TELE|nr:hypothetical protein L3Q82_007005 [Scortum barcoo]